jgi:hypothetical protein
MPMSTNCQKILLINVIQHNDRLRFLRPFYSGAFYIASKHDFDDQFFFARDSMYVRLAAKKTGTVRKSSVRFYYIFIV